MKGTCKIDECDRLTLSRGLCQRHYHRFRQRGTLEQHANPIAPVSSRHSLSEVDEESKTAICAICGPTTFRTRGGGRGRQCMVLRRAERNRYRNDRPLTPAERRCRKYKLTAAEYLSLMERARGECELCGVDILGQEKIDHCHETGTVRGVLCHRCNVGLGWFDDSPPRLLAAYLYLKAGGRGDEDWVNRSA